MRRVVAALLALSLAGIAPVESRDEPLAGWFDLPVQGGAATLATLAIPVEERAFTLPILARALHDSESRLGLSSAKVARLLADLAPAAASASRPEALTIPAPLD